MAGHAAGLAVEQIQARLGLGRDGRRIAVEEAAEGRVDEDQRPLEGRDRPADVLVVHFPAVGLLEGLLVLGNVADGLQGGRFVGHSHLDRVEDRHAWPGGPGWASGRPRRTTGAAAALSVVGAFRLPNCSVALRDSLRDGPLIGEAAGHVMAGGAGDGVVLGEPRVEIELPAQLDALGRHQVVGGDVGRPGDRIEPGRGLGHVRIELQFLKFRQLLFRAGVAMFALGRLGRGIGGQQRPCQASGKRPAQQRQRCRMPVPDHLGVSHRYGPFKKNFSNTLSAI